MPNMANIVVKDQSDNDITFVAKSSAAGDGSFATWQTAGVSPLLSTDFRVKTQFNGKRDARRIEISGAVPFSYDSVLTGRPELSAVMPFSFTMAIPQNVEAVSTANMSALVSNLLASTLVKEILATGYAPT